MLLLLPLLLDLAVAVVDVAVAVAGVSMVSVWALVAVLLPLGCRAKLL